VAIHQLIGVNVPKKSLDSQDGMDDHKASIVLDHGAWLLVPGVDHEVAIMMQLHPTVL
jgi:hypothetical protein